MIRKGNSDIPCRATFITHKAAEHLSFSKRSSLVFILVDGRSNETEVCMALLSLSLQTVIQPSSNGPGHCLSEIAVIPRMTLTRCHVLSRVKSGALLWIHTGIADTNVFLKETLLCWLFAYPTAGF